MADEEVRQAVLSLKPIVDTVEIILWIADYKWMKKHKGQG